MPTSPSQRRGAKTAQARPPPAPSRAIWPRLVLIAAAAVLAVVVAALPASLITRFLPPGVRVEDLSGTVWHGSAARINAAGRPAGAAEWRLHPLGLLRLHTVADLHWVKGGFVLDGAVDLDRTGLAASGIEGGGSITDLRDLGIAAGWQGMAAVKVQELEAVWSDTGITLKSATGEITLSDVSASGVADGAPLGGYVLKFANPALSADSEATATLGDTGGPLSVDATIRISMKTHAGMFSAAIQERPQAPAALRNALQSLAQLHAPDARGRIPVDLEFTF
jgi:Type II secretion system (T2SS), protein N